MKVGDTVKVLRDFPRLGARTGDRAIVLADRKTGYWLIAFPPTGFDRREVVVMREWIEALPGPPLSPPTKSPGEGD